jgi:hypothetical protein
MIKNLLKLNWLQICIVVEVLGFCFTDFEGLRAIAFEKMQQHPSSFV